MFNHPNLMKLEGVYASDNSLYLALEFVEGSPVCSKNSKLMRFS